VTIPEFVQPAPRSELKWALVDLDGTLAEPTWSPDNPTSQIGAPILKNVDKALRLHFQGMKLVIHTARPWSDYEAIEAWCWNYAIPVKAIICGKLLGAFYIDDRNVDIRCSDWSDPNSERDE